MTSPAEWLEADHQGGFASGTADGIRTRRYHAILLVQTPQGRVALVNGFEAWVGLPGGPVPITSQFYAPGVTHPDGATRITGFEPNPWPSWAFTLPDGSTLLQELFVAAGQTNLRWTRNGAGPATLHLRPLLSVRDYHGLQHENPAFDFAAESTPQRTLWRPDPARPPITAWGGEWAPDPQWYRQFRYTQETSRGLDDTEDLASPGILSWDLATPATLAFRADTDDAAPIEALARSERTRRRAMPPLHRTALQYVATRGDGQTILAGFPWFTDWGRDSFIALRGLLLATGHHAIAEQVLLQWSAHVQQGMLPNRFPDGNGPPEYNAVDASLWFIVAVHDLLQNGPTSAAPTLQSACTAILEGYTAGTRYNIGAGADGLLHAGVPGVQLTWMDAKIGGHVFTPRIGKPVEVQALWINALRIAAAWPGGTRWAAAADQATASFLARFPDPATGGLLDLVDGDPAESARIRPNQIFAIGGLPFSILPPALAATTLALVESRLLTPMGLRTLDPADPAYQPHYTGPPAQRDAAYHQGTVWPWLLGPFVEAWLRVHGDTPANQARARTRFLPTLEAHLHASGGHITEVADGAAPHPPGGCPFQAWSLGEYLRLQALLSPGAGEEGC